MAGNWVNMVREGDVPRVLEGFTDAVDLSFRTNPVRNLTKSEVRRRSKICADLFEMLKGDLDWSIPKIMDLLPIYLQCRLDGIQFNPEDVGDTWSASAVKRVHGVAPDPLLKLSLDG